MNEKHPPLNALSDEHWMRLALKLARRSAEVGEVPVGAVLVGPEGAIAVGANRRETLHTPLGHAELMALHRGAKKRKNWRLEDTTLYVTLEPCLMCAGAILQARVGRVVFGAHDPRGGAVESLFKTFRDPRLNHQVNFTTGVLGVECAELLQSFFQSRRREQKLEKLEKVYRQRASVVVVHQNRVLGFHAKDPVGGREYFFIPGGMIEHGESAEECALRETLEETGYRIRLLPGLSLRRQYDFSWSGKVNPCDTTFFVGILDEAWHEPGDIQDASYHLGVDWVSTQQAKKYFSYHEDVLWGVQWGLKNMQKWQQRNKPSS